MLTLVLLEPSPLNGPEFRRWCNCEDYGYDYLCSLVISNFLDCLAGFFLGGCGIFPFGCDFGSG